MPLTDEQAAEIRTSLKRCSTETIEATLRFRESQDTEELPTIVYGIIERYLSPEHTRALSEAPDETKLVEELGIDSLTMLEIVLSIEEAIGIRIENEELREIGTLGQVKLFINKKVTGQGETVSEKHSLMKLTREEIALVLPQQPPFLFLDGAEIEDDVVHARYHITGDEYFLEGHFKDNPVFPASIVFEALGQAGCLWILEFGTKNGSGALNSNEVLFASMEGARFHRRAKPGDTLEMELKLTLIHAPLAIFSGVVSVNGKKIAQVDRLELAFGDEIAERLEAAEKEPEIAPSEPPAPANSSTPASASLHPSFATAQPAA